MPKLSKHVDFDTSWYIFIVLMEQTRSVYKTIQRRYRNNRTRKDVACLQVFVKSKRTCIYNIGCGKAFYTSRTALMLLLVNY
ncbi:hypothetical protein HanIR_Chr03g0121941 [Helianthus annuus]|nr:hypothetical protein HanIR_Chr03g0121941 [Helianthus annuus]